MRLRPAICCIWFWSGVDRETVQSTSVAEIRMDEWRVTQREDNEYVRGTLGVSLMVNEMRENR